MDSRMTDGVRRLGGGRIEWKEKRTHGHGQQWLLAGAGIRGPNGNGRKYNKDEIFIKAPWRNGQVPCLVT